MKVKTSTLLIFLTALSAVSAGCGYTMKDQYHAGVNTVFVPVWTRGKDVYRRELEMRLTEAIQKRIEQDTPYKVVAKTRADTELSGRIDRVEQRVLSRNPQTGRPREMEVTFCLSFVWRDLRTGKVLVEQTNFRVTDNYIPHEPLMEDFFQGSEAVINRAAQLVVEKMEADW
jgi:outer membrane lipopolysaccharide assembly protein LptE/RlpB